jgi:hypothetical protein
MLDNVMQEQSTGAEMLLAPARLRLAPLFYPQAHQLIILSERHQTFYFRPALHGTVTGIQSIKTLSISML